MGSFSGRSSVIVRRGLAGADRPDQVPSPFIYHLSSASIHLFAFLPVSTPLPPSRVLPLLPPPSPPCHLDTLPVSPAGTFVSMSPMPSILPPIMPLLLPHLQYLISTVTVSYPALLRPFPTVHPIPIPPLMSRQRASLEWRRMPLVPSHPRYKN
jgi:hypothetical protein